VNNCIKASRRERQVHDPEWNAGSAINNLALVEIQDVAKINTEVFNQNFVTILSCKNKVEKIRYS